MAIGYTYITEIHTKRRVLFYGGKKTSAKFDPNYLGSGRVVKLLKSRIRDKMIVRIHEWHETLDDMNAAERKLIAHLRAEHGKLCVNVNDGGDGFSPTMSARIESSPHLKKKRVEGIRKAWQCEKRRAAAADMTRAMMSDPERRQRFMAAARTEAAREKATQSHRARWANPEHRQYMISALSSEKKCMAVSAGQKIAWQNPDIRARRTAALAEKHKDHEFLARRKKAVQQAALKPENRKMRQDIATALWSDPEYKARRVAQLKQVMNTPEAIAKRSAAIKAAWARRKALSQNDAG